LRYRVAADVVLGATVGCFAPAAPTRPILCLGAAPPDPLRP
jgi:hypothetical protein